MNDEIFGWFPGESQRAMENIIKENNIKTVLEVGCFLGKATAFMAKLVDSVTVIDPFVKWEDAERPNGDIEKYGGEDFYDKFVDNMKSAGVINKILAHRSTSIEGMEFYLNRVEYKFKPDLIYIDALHDYDNVLADILCALRFNPKVICGDDYDENWPGVKGAVNEIFGDQVIVDGRLWYVNLSV